LAEVTGDLIELCLDQRDFFLDLLLVPPAHALTGGMTAVDGRANWNDDEFHG
jgi:hypothetical protein